jgi:hypothetical protein
LIQTIFFASFFKKIFHPPHRGAFHFVVFGVITLRAKNSVHTNCSIDMYALPAIAYCGVPFSIDMNALQAIAGISR